MGSRRDSSCKQVDTQPHRVNRRNKLPDQRHRADILRHRLAKATIRANLCPRQPMHTPMEEIIWPSKLR